MDSPTVRRLTTARIPTADGEFTLSLYENSEDDKDHLALICGDIRGAEEVLVRVHSECFTGDVLGSLRCDCGEQLNTSMRRIAEEGQGVILYLRQEGRGIGLQSKLRAYNLQDEGYDTVEANRLLGHGADERDYTIAAMMLRDLGISSVQLLTNNPEKIESLEEHGIDIRKRVALRPHVNQHNAEYLRTKVHRMRHILDLGPVNGESGGGPRVRSSQSLDQRAHRHYEDSGIPYVTLTYAQSLDGSIASNAGEPLPLSGEAALGMTHRLRAAHDAILVGIGTVLADDPRLNVRRGSGAHPVPVVLDSSLRFPLDARLLECDGPAPHIFSGPDVDPQKQAELKERGATVRSLSCGPDGDLCLESLLQDLGERGFASVMVEGGHQVLTSFFRQRYGQRVVVTIAPSFVGGTPALGPMSSGENGNSASARLDYPRLENIQYRWYGRDLVMEGDPVWPSTE